MSLENEFNILKKTIESSSTESINKEKIDDLEYEINDGRINLLIYWVYNIYIYIYYISWYVKLCGNH